MFNFSLPIWFGSFWLTSPLILASIKGVFCISLDFEKYWGVHDVLPISEVNHFKQVQEVVNELLQLFNRYEIHVTWATVGLLGQENMDELKSISPKAAIPYANQRFSPFPLTTEKYANFDSDLLLGNKEIESIKHAENQELGSHTFSHFYTMEAGVSTADFETDCQAMAHLSNRLETPFKSIVFPRNQVNKTCLEICRKHGYTTFRGNQENRYWKNSAFESESTFKKMGRVLDAYFKISKTRAYQMASLKTENGLINVPANRFFRPATRNKLLEKRKIRRIKNEMFKAARKGTVYHLWWHPHNFSDQLDIHLNQLEELLAYYQVLNDKFGFQSLHMSEISAHVKS